MLDTNVLFLPLTAGFPLEAEVARLVPGGRLVLPSSASDELDRLAVSGTPRAEAARRLAARLPREATAERGDAGIIDVARRLRATVVTADRELQDRLLALGIPVLVPRDRHRLERRDGRRAAASGNS